MAGLPPGSHGQGVALHFCRLDPAAKSGGAVAVLLGCLAVLLGILWSMAAAAAVLYLLRSLD